MARKDRGWGPRRRSRRGLLFLALLLASVLLPVGAGIGEGRGEGRSAPARGDLSSKDCGRCHREYSYDKLPASVHREFFCTLCHEGARKLPHEDPRSPENCARCHEEIVRVYGESVHGEAWRRGVPDVPTCGSCHGGHDIRPKGDPQSRVFPFNLPRTCGRCHGDVELARAHEIPVPEAYQQYLESVHGQGLLKGGLLVAATCVDCHGSHDIRPNDDPRSRLYRDRVGETCGTCHLGVLEELQKSVHGRLPPEEAPTCIDCHRTHAIPPPYERGFRLASVLACAECHPELFETYRETYHGQVTALGYAGVATCADCHGNHLILPAEEPGSTLSRENLQGTCRKCHPRANENFVEFIPHVNPRDPRSAPRGLYAVWLFMTLLLVGVFGVFGLHTLLWVVRGYLIPALGGLHRRARAT